MKKHLLTLLATGAFLSLAGSAMAQTAPAAAPAASADQSADPALIDPNLAPDTQAVAQPKLRFKIKGVNGDDDGEEGDDGQHGDGHGESEDDNG